MSGRERGEVAGDRYPLAAWDGDSQGTHGATITLLLVLVEIARPFVRSDREDGVGPGGGAPAPKANMKRLRGVARRAR